jgi:hypothetical protein
MATINYLRRKARKTARQLGHIPAGKFQRYEGDAGNPNNVYTHCTRCCGSIVIWANGPGPAIWGGGVQDTCKGQI